MYYDIIRKQVGNAGLIVVEGENSQQIMVFNGEGKEIANVNTAYDCPEDNTVRRLGILDFAEQVYNTACSTEVPVDKAFTQAQHYVVTDGQGTADSFDVLIPIKYVVGEEVILYADVEGYARSPFAVDLSLDEDPVDVFNQHMQAAGFLTEDERFEEVKK